MKKFFFVAAFLSFYTIVCGATTLPNPAFTPGALCTANSADFQKFDYPEKIARCNRNIALPEKQQVADNYGKIPQSEWKNYEFDHYIPLCAGGANDSTNLWPQPIAEAHMKDQLEDQICLAMKAGTLTQAQAVQKVHDWFQHLVLPDTNSPKAPEAPISSLAKSAFVCELDSRQHLESSSPIRVSFDRFSATTISSVRAELLENGDANEIISSGDREIEGIVSGARRGPLKDLLRYSIKDGRDKFELYLPDGGDEELSFAYFKVSFDGTYPQFNRLKCKKTLN